MPSRYESGTKSFVLQMMVKCAIRDRQALIDAYTQECVTPDEKASQAICEAERLIKDFRRLAKSGCAGVNKKPRNLNQ